MRSCNTDNIILEYHDKFRLLAFRLSQLTVRTPYQTELLHILICPIINSLNELPEPHIKLRASPYPVCCWEFPTVSNGRSGETNNMTPWMWLIHRFYRHQFPDQSPQESLLSSLQKPRLSSLFCDTISAIIEQGLTPQAWLKPLLSGDKEIDTPLRCLAIIFFHYPADQKLGSIMLSLANTAPKEAWLHNDEAGFSPFVITRRAFEQSADEDKLSLFLTAAQATLDYLNTSGHYMYSQQGVDLSAAGSSLTFFKPATVHVTSVTKATELTPT